MIKNSSELNKQLDDKVQTALKYTQEVIDQCVQDAANEYYHENVMGNRKVLTEHLASIVSASVIKKESFDKELADFVLMELGGEDGIMELLKSKLREAGLTVK
ncbi:hypothetical protein C0033_07365 [Clostridium sp. chh4-2]|uniref:hypothetical protein n=1 Tax=Clostridium sp. chh4-2 TaxID=2067550 RepID=UPI000CCF1D2D|nr:hypothetical protein [Clostridium sp. chh4-2]PNV62827.1 hypothetical protein C0033_07365 [Clostridium sp. chh4-2]